MTEQEIFDTVLTHLREQGKAAATDDGDCKYRGTRGTACAVGCLIPDELYNPLIEGLSVDQIFKAAMPEHHQHQAQARAPFTRITNHIGAEHLQLLQELQDAHDVYLFDLGMAAWEEGMHRIARDFYLKYTPA